MLNIISLVCGLLFGLGLSIAQMTNPNKVLNFLDITGNWDPSLLVVLAAALATAFIGYRIAQRKTKPIFSNQFYLPTAQSVDWRLTLGAIIFGIGWGIGGYCPGPAIAALAIGWKEPVILCISMFVGFWLAKQLSNNEIEP